METIQRAELPISLTEQSMLRLISERYEFVDKRNKSVKEFLTEEIGEPELQPDSTYRWFVGEFHIDLDHTLPNGVNKSLSAVKAKEIEGIVRYSIVHLFEYRYTHAFTY